jgi:hypothetical protein
MIEDISIKIMSLDNFSWKKGMLAYTWGDFIKVTSVNDGIPGILHKCFWTGDLTQLDIVHHPIVVYTDQETANILDLILPDWRTHVGL